MNKYLKIFLTNKNKDLQYKIVEDVIIIEPKTENPVNSEPEKLSQTIKGQVVDKESLMPLIGATIIIEGFIPIIGTTADENGFYKLLNIPLGRYDIAVSFIGYEPYVTREVLVNSSKEVIINFYLKEAVTEIGYIGWS